MLSLDTWLSLFPPSVRNKPRFMALAAAVLTQSADLLGLIQSAFPAALSLDSAVGAQLDALGEILNVPRPSASTSDAVYRFLLRARVAVYRWDGTNETLPSVLENAFPDNTVQIVDNLDGTVTATVTGTLPFPLEDLLPFPAGVRLKTV